MCNETLDPRADGQSHARMACDEDRSSTYGFHGRHVLADLHGLDAGVLNDVRYLRLLLGAGVARAGATLIETMDFRFHPVGVTILMLLAESHVSLHTYPREGRAFFDAFTCGDTCDPEKILRMFCEPFPQCVLRTTTIMRGEPGVMRRASLDIDSSAVHHPV